jgi:hypothetical protein
MSLVGLGTKNYCASEGQQQLSSQVVSQSVSNFLEQLKDSHYYKLVLQQLTAQ